MAVGPQISVLAPRFSRVVSIFVVLICVVTAVSLVQYGHPEPLLRGLPALALVSFGVYTVFWAPLVRITPAEIEVVNPFRTVHAPWPAIRDITARWSLTIVTDQGEFSSWAAPAQGPWGSIGRLRRDALGRPSLSSESSEGAAEGSAAGIAPLVIRQWQTYRDEPSAGDRAVRVHWHLASIVTLGVLAVLTLVAIFWP